MTALQWFMIFLGPFLAVAPFVVAAAPQIPGFWGRRPAPTRTRVTWSAVPAWA